MSTEVIKGDALDLPLPDNSVDLIVTSPPYFGLRAYEDGGLPVEGQIGQEPTAARFVDALLDATDEALRVLRPTGSLWVNLGERYINRSLSGIPWRYAIRCTDELGLALRAEVVWSKPNQFIDAKANDRVRRTHETWLHFTRPGKYLTDVDAIRVAPEADYRDRPQYRRAEELFTAANLTEAHRAAVRAVGVARRAPRPPSVRFQRSIVRPSELLRLRCRCSVPTTASSAAAAASAALYPAR